MFRELKTGIEIFVGQVFFFIVMVMDQNSQNIVLINNSRTTWPTSILMLFLSFGDNLLHFDEMHDYIIIILFRY